MAVLSQTIAIPVWTAVVSILAIVALAVLIRGLETKRQLAAVVGIAALLAAVSGGIVSSDRTDVATPAPRDRVVGGPEAERRVADVEPAQRAAPAAPSGPEVPVTAARLPVAPTAVSTATMALAASGLASDPALLSAVKSPRIARTQPAPEAVAALDTPAERPPAAAEGSGAAEVALARRQRGVVPPAASVLSNLEFPSSDSIPPVSIMNTEPKLPEADRAPAAASTAPKASPRSQ